MNGSKTKPGWQAVNGPYAIHLRVFPDGEFQVLGKFSHPFHSIRLATQLAEALKVEWELQRKKHPIGPGTHASRTKSRVIPERGLFGNMDSDGVELGRRLAAIPTLRLRGKTRPLRRRPAAVRTEKNQPGPFPKGAGM